MKRYAQRQRSEASPKWRGKRSGNGRRSSNEQVNEEGVNEEGMQAHGWMENTQNRMIIQSAHHTA